MLQPSLKAKLIAKYAAEVILAAEKIKNEFSKKLEEQLSLSSDQERLKILKEYLRQYRAALKAGEHNDPFKGGTMFSSLVQHSMISNIGNNQIGIIRKYPGEESFAVLEQFIKELYDYILQLIEGLREAETLLLEESGFDLKSALNTFKVEIKKSVKDFRSEYYEGGAMELLLQEYIDSDGDEKIETIFEELPHIFNELITNSEKKIQISKIHFSNTISVLKAHANASSQILNSV